MCRAHTKEPFAPLPPHHNHHHDKLSPRDYPPEQTLEQQLEEMRATYQLNTEKLEYNYRVLTERDMENSATLSHQKRKLTKLKDALSGLVQVWGVLGGTTIRSSPIHRQAALLTEALTPPHIMHLLHTTAVVGCRVSNHSRCQETDIRFCSHARVARWSTGGNKKYTTTPLLPPCFVCCTSMCIKRKK